MRRLLALFALLSAGIAAAQGVPGIAGAGEEHLATMPLVGLAPHMRTLGNVIQTDWLPPGAAPDRAARMVTIERMRGAAGDGAPLSLIRGFATCLTACPETGNGAIDQTPFQGRPAARIAVDLPANPRTGAGPTRIHALAVSGGRDLHVVIVLIRGELSPGDIAFAEQVMRSVVLCAPGAAAPACHGG